MSLQAKAADRMPADGIAGGRVATGPGLPLQMGVRRGRLQSTGMVSLGLVFKFFMFPFSADNEENNIS